MTEEQAFTLGVNAISLGDERVISAAGAEELNAALRDRGIEVIEIDLDHVHPRRRRAPLPEPGAEKGDGSVERTGDRRGARDRRPARASAAHRRRRRRSAALLGRGLAEGAGVPRRAAREIGLDYEVDEAGNAWTYLEGETEPALAVGSHLDSVPDGGWLDGALGVMGALGVLRAWAGAEGKPPRSIALVDWADEEGARFGRSLFGSSAAAGTFDPAELANARDADGRRAAGVLAENGVDLDRVLECRSRLERLGSYLELHIEQGPVLEAEGIRAAAVSGCAGVERVRFVVSGQAAHAGTTPMDGRRDPGLVAAAAALRIEEIARAEGGVGTVGVDDVRSGHPDRGAGDGLDARRPPASGRGRAGANARGRPRVDPLGRRGARAARSPRSRSGGSSPSPSTRSWSSSRGRRASRSPAPLMSCSSGALHDAASMAPHLPAAMVFSPSIGGISHAREEDTAEADLAAAIESFRGAGEPAPRPDLAATATDLAC